MRLLTRIALLLAIIVASRPGIVPAQSRATIKIATQSPLSTERAPGGEGIRLGAELAIEHLKAPLERMGFRVELLSFDDQGRPDVAVAKARNIVADRDILAVVGHLDARVAIPASEIYKEATLAMVSPAGTGTLLTDRNLPGVSRVCGRDDVQGLVAAEFAAVTLMVKSVYVLHDGTIAAPDVAELFKTQAERRGLKVLGLEGVRGPADVDPLIAAIRAGSIRRPRSGDGRTSRASGPASSARTDWTPRTSRAWPGPQPSARTTHRRSPRPPACRAPSPSSRTSSAGSAGFRTSTPRRPTTPPASC